jgi:O-methyltransferase involved in polyketide biosynthesis
MTKAQARAWRKRWKLVNAREMQELRSTSPEIRLQQFNNLLAWAQQLGWTEELRRGEADVRERWIRLRKAFKHLPEQEANLKHQR